MNINIETFKQLQLKKELPDIRPGDTVKVHQKVKEGNKERIQVFEGIVIARKHGKGISTTITVRKVVEGVGVERIFPIHSPFISKIEVVKSGKVRRAKLYYLRKTKGKKAQLKKRDFSMAVAQSESEVTETPQEAETTKESTPAEQQPDNAQTK